jgi:carboxymethylenebutenolidase
VVETPHAVSFRAGNLTLHGFLYRPEGPGPFAAVIWNHGSERQPGSQDKLGMFYASAGYVCFCPHRHGHGLSPGEYALGAVPTGTREQGIHALIGLQEDYLRDTVAAATWLSGQAFVDPTRMAMSGVSHGAIQTILAAEADAGPAAYVPFAPAAIGWQGNPELQERLERAVRSARAPMFLLQAENDYSLGPSEILGAELERKGAPNLVRVYPPYGHDQASGHGAFARHGMDVWGADVCAFLDEALTAGRRRLDSRVC